VIKSSIHPKKLAILLSIVAIAVGATFYFVDPVPQDLNYHQFVDQRALLGVPNCFNVVSSLAFIVVGLYGLARVIRVSGETDEPTISIAHYLFFGGLILTGLGSGYYHLNPSNGTLVLDRLPMTIAFMSLFSFFICEHFNQRVGATLLWPLLAVGVLSVMYWIYTENQNAGDLRWYALVQFLPVLLIPLIIVLFPVKTYRIRYLWYLIGLYALAKLAELFDRAIMDIITISGHTVKHVLAALTGIAFLKLILSKRRGAS
jgi:hypothetical protein